MHENVDISKELQETKLLFDNVLLTLGGGEGGTSSKSDDKLLAIAQDILSKVSFANFGKEQMKANSLYTNNILGQTFW